MAFAGFRRRSTASAVVSPCSPCDAVSRGVQPCEVQVGSCPFRAHTRTIAQARALRGDDKASVCENPRGTALPTVLLCHRCLRPPDIRHTNRHTIADGRSQHHCCSGPQRDTMEKIEASLVQQLSSDSLRKRASSKHGPMRSRRRICDSRLTVCRDKCCRRSWVGPNSQSQISSSFARQWFKSYRDGQECAASLV